MTGIDKLYQEIALVVKISDIAGIVDDETSDWHTAKMQCAYCTADDRPADDLIVIVNPTTNERWWARKTCPEHTIFRWLDDAPTPEKRDETPED